jgi:chemosensory pili system protein ChpA (sensor histidine kinase/response regulator)
VRLQDHTDFTTLHWVKGELDDALAKARQALESYVEDSRDTYVMHTCAADLHQVHGTLRMVELYGAAMVVGEMEQLVAALIEGRVANTDEAYAVLMRGMMQMPDYLERLQSGHRDVPVVLLPLLNDLRASRGEQSLDESVLFTPPLDTPLPLGVPGAANPVVAEAHRGELAELRLRFQQQLLAWFRGQGGDRLLLSMRATLDALSARCYTLAGRRLWWIAGGILEGLERGVLRGHEKEVRPLIGRVDRAIRELVEGGEDALLSGDSDELARKLLYYAAQARAGSPRIEELRQTYRLDGLLPREHEVEHARGSMSGHNRALLDTVSGAIKEDLLRVKESLDLFLRRPDGDPAQLGAQADVLDRVGDTLGMLALGVPRRVVGEQRRILGEIAGGTRRPDEEALLDVAGALLYVEASLDDHIERLGAEGDAPLSDHGPSPLPRSEARHILATLMREAVANTARVKDAIVAFVESSWDHGHLSGAPDQMAEIGGAMRMLGADRPAELADGIGLFIHRELLGDRRVPNAAQMDRLADAVAALEYYLEAAREHRGGLDHILDVTQQSLAELGYWPVPLVDAGTEEAPGRVASEVAETPPAEAAPADASPANDMDAGSVTSFADTFDVADAPATEAPAQPEQAAVTAAAAPEPAAAAAAGEEDWVEIEEEVEQHIGAPGPTEFAGFQVTVDGIDDEIREIFLEETQEEIDNLQAALSQWLAEPERKESLTPIRRSFHTLKGSGRLVGARLLGEFAWKVENMLNRVLDGSVEPHEGVQALVRHAVDALPQLKAALEGESSVDAPIAAIMETADRLAMGDMATVEDVARHATQTVRTRVKRRVPRETIDAVPTAAFAHYGQGAALAEPQPEAEPSAYGEPPLPPVDAVLLDILRTEVAQYQHVIRAYLARASAGSLPVDDGLLRAVHTLHGAIGMVDIPVLIQVLAPLEGLIKRVRATGQPLRADGVQALSDAADLVDHVMALFDTPDPRVPDVSALAAHIAALRDEQPEATVAHILYGPDPDFLANEEPDALPADDTPGVLALDDAAVEPAEHEARVAEPLPLTPAHEDLADVLQLDEVEPLAEPVGDADESATTDAATDESREAPEALHVDDAGADALKAEHPAGDAAVPDDTASIEADPRTLEAELEALLAAEHAALEAAGPQPDEMDASETGEHAEHAPASDAAEPEGELPPIAPFLDDDEDLTARLLASMEASAPQEADLPAPEVRPILAYDPNEEAAWRSLTSELAEEAPNAPVEDAFAAVHDEPLAAEHAAEDAPSAETIAPADAEHVTVELPGDDADRGADADRDSDAEAATADSAHDVLPQPMSHDGERLYDEADDGVLADEPVAQPLDEPEASSADEDRAGPVEAVIHDQSHEPVGAPVHAAVADDADALVPELSPYADVDADLLEVFVEEGREILDHADAALAALRAEPSQAEHLAALQRDLHTLKGSARMAGMSAVGDMAHAMEALLDAVAAGQRDNDRAAIEAMEAGFDRLHGMIQSIAQLQPVVLLAADVEPFERLSGAPIAPDTLTAESYRDEREDAARHAEPSPAEAPASAAPVEDEPEPIPVLDRVLPDLLPEIDEEQEVQRASQEQIRVRADMLDTLVNHAGEVSIYRSRLEQQTASFRSALTEHEQTVARLRSQLRMLEIETEAQIIARYHQEHRDTGATTFDPLELDRFSQLQQYSRALAESVSDLVSLQTILDDLTRQTETLLLQQQKVNAELQEGLMQTRMLPFDAMVPNLRRTLRQAATDVGKRAQLVVEGANGEMDRNMLDRIKAPFEHMLRNAVAHGIEPPAAREAAGKPAEGTVRIQVAREATEVVVKLSDDGAGMDRDAIRAKAIERGLLRPDARVSDDQIFQLTQVPGFSTAEKVTQVAGRGVGMDVVANEIKQLGGTLSIDSRHGEGTVFTMRLPFTLAVTQALIVRIGEISYAIPMTSVHAVARVEPNELAHRMADPDPRFEYAGEDYAIYDLPQLLGINAPSTAEEGDMPLLLARSGDLRVAIRVDTVLGSREIVVKPVGPQVSSVPGILGATIMGDGSVLMILDLAPLVRHGMARRAFAVAGEPVDVTPRAQDEVRVKPLVMVVDDSITMRKVTGRVLERHEFEVVTAKDGIDALEKLNERVPDLMLLDIEMPRMDGYELATEMKRDDRLSAVPIIMITSRTGEKHRQRAFDIGVDRYIGKPYQENDLVAQIVDVLGVHRYD